MRARLRISETGCLERAEVWQSSGVAELDQAALQYAAEVLTWMPAEKDGKAVASPATLPVRFTLRRGFARARLKPGAQARALTLCGPSESMVDTHRGGT